MPRNLNSPARIRKFLNEAFETGDSFVIARAIGEVARAQRMSEIAKKAGLSRESTYRALRGERNTRFNTIMRVLTALKLQLAVKAKKRASSDLK